MNVVSTRCRVIMYSDSVQYTSSELAEIRVELARLEKQEQELVQKLCHVRAAIQVQRTKLAMEVPAPIDRLPNELLMRIFKLSVRESGLELGGVSRRWRDVVLHCPSLWTTIRVTERMSLLKLKTHVTRSSESPLDIEIQLWNEPLLNTVLGALIPCAHRWRSLVIHSVNHELLKNMLTTMKCTTYPSLTHLSIRSIWNNPPSMTLWQFYPRSCPRLEHLELEGHVEFSSVLEVPPGVTSLSLSLWDAEVLSILQRSSLQKLTSLFISRWERKSGMQLRSNSIHLPLLETFVFKTGGVPTQSDVLIKAIVAPKLAYFEYDSSINCNIFGTRTPKFPNVVHVVLQGFEGPSAAVPFAFPAARHIDLTHPMAAESLFSPTDGSITAVDWPHLESLTIRDVAISSLDFLDGLVRWLKARRNMGILMLLARFAFYNPGLDEGVVTALPEAGSIVTILYEALHGLCKLEWVDVPLAGIVLSGTLNESLRLVCALHLVVTSKLTPFPYRRCQTYIPISLRISARQSLKDVSEAVQDPPAQNGCARTIIIV